ncbi:hypothetical protein [Nostoc sp. ChiSLP03a]|uniref:hypothetical protein n=1 Tax=Nostoc sp. ChiSLP03a TaxID=3075380 RepID=UPI002AD417EE|nr:hypothetical protein [Nostoc sp. ChiSLP03a]MDZ8214568.1 hypothetical protein [Nostoc sp. ChiSLP03a]
MDSQQNRVFVLKVGITKKGEDFEYDDVSYCPDYNWIEKDKQQIEEVIRSFYNSHSLSGEKIVHVSCGKVILTHSKHPDAPRMKLIQGFLQESSLASVIFRPLASKGNISSILVEISPESIKNNPQAISYLNDLDREVQLSEIKVEKLKVDIFNAVLEILEKNSQFYTGDKISSRRLPHLIANIRTFYQDQHEV